MIGCRKERHYLLKAYPAKGTLNDPTAFMSSLFIFFYQLFYQAKRCCCILIDRVQIRWPYKLILVAQVVNDDSIVLFSRCKRDIAVDDIAQYQLQRALQWIAVAATTWWVELDACVRWNSNERFGLWMGCMVHQELACRTWFAAL